MKQFHDEWRTRIISALQAVSAQFADSPVDIGTLESTILIETPPSSDLGDIAFPMFPFAKVLRANPAKIAGAVAGYVNEQTQGVGTAHAVGPYVNIFLARDAVFSAIVSQALEQGDRFGSTDALARRRVMVEFSCPNTNKPLHLGHLRNDALGESLSRILMANGATVHKVNLINDRGIHICKSMLAYERFGSGETPAAAGKKSDHFVGDYYVRYAQWEKEDPEAEPAARTMLQRWESGEAKVQELWLTMNRWAIEGIEETYQRTGISFDETYYESQTYLLGREEVLKGLDRGVFYQDEKGTVWVDLTDMDLDTKVLLRADGTSLYLTQDIGTAIKRYQEWPFDQLIHVVGSEQRYHFIVLFEVLKRLGFEWAENLFHLAYGMVNLTDGRMKSREGTVVDADNLIDQLSDMAAQEIRSREREDDVGNVDETAERIAVGALHYYLLQTSPNRDMIFNPQESLAFTGNTGPYLQYTGARIESMLRRQPAPAEGWESSPEVPEEWDLAKLVAEYPVVVEQAARQFSPALVANHLYEVAKTFSRFYHDHPIAVAKDPRTRDRRLALAKAVGNVLRNGMYLLNIPYLKAM